MFHLPKSLSIRLTLVIECQEDPDTVLKSGLFVYGVWFASTNEVSYA